MSSNRGKPYGELKKPIGLLFGNNSVPPATDNVKTVKLTEIKLPASQPRRYFDQGKLEELAQTIIELGILEPLLVRPLPGGGYELVAGERRYRAAIMAKLDKVPVICKEMDEVTTHQIRLIENIQREDLNPLEETEGILELLAIRLEISIPSVIQVLYKMDNVAKGKVTRDVAGNSYTLTIEEVFIGLGKKWNSFVRHQLPILKLPEDVLSCLRSGQIEFTKAKAIAKIKDPEIRQEILTLAIEENLSISQIKEEISKIKPDAASNGNLKERINSVFGELKKSKAWVHPVKKAKIEKLLAQLEALTKEELP